MKNKPKRMTAVCLAVLMLLSCFAGLQALAAESFTTHMSGVNPVYADLYPDGAPKLQEEQESDGPRKGPAKASKQRFTSVEAVADYVRERMKAREKDAPFTLVVPARDVNARTQGEFNKFARAKVTEIMEEAVKHTGNGKEGDYLRFVYGYWEMGAGLAYNYIKREYEFETDLSIGYYTTAAQEAQVDAALTALYPTLALQGKGALEKIETIYTYLCESIVYDTEHAADNEYLPQFTAYAALIDHVAVCQGYASLFYRMALDNGLDARVIGGKAGGEGHAWNIVKLGSFYYNLDSTWDAGLPAFVFFLKSEAQFADHVRDPEYTTAAFQNAYPMAQQSYGAPVLNDSEFWTSAAAASFSAGSGTAGDPYQIGSSAQLALFSKLIGSGEESYSAAHYCLTADLDLTGKNWVPIGYLTPQTEEGILEIQSYTFSGTFDGNGHTISNLTISRLLPGCCCAGLFGAMRGAVRDLILKQPVLQIRDDQSASGSQLFVGALAGNLDLDYPTGNRAEAENCIVSDARIAVESGGTVCSGAFAGLLGESKIWDCFASGEVNAQSADHVQTGGFAGVLFPKSGVYLCGFEGSISASCSTGAQPGEDVSQPVGAAGGFAGSMIGSVIAKNCKAKAQITAQNIRIGAFCGNAARIAEKVVMKNLFADCVFSLPESEPAPDFAGGLSGLQADPATDSWSLSACVCRKDDAFAVLAKTTQSEEESLYAREDPALQAIFDSFPDEYWENGADELPALRLQKRLHCAHRFSAGTTTAPSCLQYGKTVYVCELCGQSRADSVTVNAAHTDANNDGRCDVCGSALQPQQEETICPYCGEPHTGFFAPLIYWFHALLYHFFGAKK